MTEINYASGTPFFDTNLANATLCYNSFKDPDRTNFPIIAAHSYNFGELLEDSLSQAQLQSIGMDDREMDELNIKIS